MYQDSIHSKDYMIIVIDSISILMSYIIATLVRFKSINTIWNDNLYTTGIIISFLVYLCVAIATDKRKNFYKRKVWKEFLNIIQVNLFVASLTSILLFLSQRGVLYSRAFYIIFFMFNVCFMLFIRTFYKKVMQRILQSNTRKLLVATTEEGIGNDFGELAATLPMDYEIIGISVLDKNLKGETVEGIPVVSNGEDLYEYARQSAVDEVFLSLPGYPVSKLERTILTLEHMGIIVNLSVKTFGLYPKEKMLNRFGNYNVLTYSTKLFHSTSMLVKRFMDILGAVVGLLITGIITIFVAPVIYLESPGPIFFSQTRIGKNGRRFKIYKFRSMYADAEERKKELLKQNEMQGFMFKMTNDPRITKVGKFIRKTSIDELPQFLNVLKGEMSLVGTRPPTEDEFLQYGNEHKRRLSLKPGITGLWQVSGRSDITDFEKVVELDLEYIDNWSIAKDIKILLKTLLVVIGKSGSR